MCLLAGNALDPKRFFKKGTPSIQGSSFDLAIGHIFDHQGKKVEGPFTIKPGHMVQVVSAEIFNLSDRITGHVTYKTTLTRKGIWALTVGIVDPGWDGPIATTLLNFSRIDHAIAEGDTFLRVSFFEHDQVPAEKLRKAPPLDAYLKDIQKIAASMFPATFLNTEEIAKAAGNSVLHKIRIEALAWIVGIALIFTLGQIVANWFASGSDHRDLQALRDRMVTMEMTLLRVEEANVQTPSGIAATSTHVSSPRRSNSPSPAPPVQRPKSP